MKGTFIWKLTLIQYNRKTTGANPQGKQFRIGSKCLDLIQLTY